MVKNKVYYLEQERVLMAHGVLCYSCGNLVESLIGNDGILKTPAGHPTLCSKCEKAVEGESISGYMTTNYFNDIKGMEEYFGFEPVYQEYEFKEE